MKNRLPHLSSHLATDLNGYEIFENLPVLPFDGTPPEETDFYHDVLTVDNNGLSSALISFLSTREEKLLDLLRKHPSEILSKVVDRV
jgi:hypothetical protein